MNLLLITDAFPYGTAEKPFIGVELPVLARRFGRVTIVPLVLPPESERPMQLPPNVAVRLDVTQHFGREQWERSNQSLLTILGALPGRLAWKAVLDAVRCRPFTPREVIDGFAGDSLSLARSIQQLIAPEDREVVYSYWLMRGALTAALLKQSSDCRIAVGRAHGYDVYPHRHGARHIPFRRTIFSCLDGIYPTSIAAKNFLLNSSSALHKNIKSMYLGVSSQESICPPSTDNVLRIVTCSSLATVKRVDLITHAIAQLKRRTEWVHIGGASKDLDALREQMKIFPSHIKASALGSTPHAGVLTYYRSHPVDVFVNASNSEGLPVSIMEAMAFGIPCIATDAGGNREIVQPENGLLLPVESGPQTIAAVLETWDATNGARRAAARRTQQIYFDAAVNNAAFADELLARATAA